jgi:TATA-binding protein-associated factor Taf7
MSAESSKSATPVDGGEGVIEKYTPNGKRTERLTQSPVNMSDEDEDGEQRIESRNGEQRGRDVHEENEFTEQHESGEEQEDDDDDGEEEEEDDEDEPSLKYQRISGAIPDLLKKDSASALAISNKTIVSRSFRFFMRRPPYSLCDL